MATEGDRSSEQRRVRITPAASPASASAMTIVVVALVAALYLGRELLIPLALAVLLSFAIAPLTTRLRRWRIGRVPSVLLVVTLVFLLIAGFGMLVTSQISSLADNVSRYETNFRTKIRAFGEVTASGGPFAQIKRVWVDIEKELEKASQPAPEPANRQKGGAPAAGDQPAPIPVEVHQPPAKPVELVTEFAGGLLKPLATAGIIVVFVIFFLLQREDLRDRFIRLFGSRDVHRATDAMTDAAKRVSRYLLMQVCINAFYALSVGFGLWMIGVPHPLLWALLGGVLRFIPYVGPTVGAGIPLLVAIAAEPGWTMPLLTVALFVTLEMFINNFLEPWLYGSSTGLSPVAILVAAVFWTTLWGPVGLLLATPLTVCLVVLGRHVPQLQFLEVLLGSEPVLPTEVKFYQRLLAGDPDEAEEVVEEYLEEKRVQDLYQNVLLPALAFADQDRLRGGLDRERWGAVAQNVMEIIADQRDVEASSEAASSGKTTEGKPLRPAGDGPPAEAQVLCIGARNRLDEAAAAMLAHLLDARGCAARVLPCTAVSPGNLHRLAANGVAAVCLSYVNPEALHHARRLNRRLRHHFASGVPIILCLWNGAAPADRLQDTRKATGADRLATTLSAAAQAVEDGVQPSISVLASPALASPSAA